MGTQPAVDTGKTLIEALAEAGDALERIVDLINHGRPHGAAVVASAALGKIAAMVDEQAQLNRLVNEGWTIE